MYWEILRQQIADALRNRFYPGRIAVAWSMINYNTNVMKWMIDKRWQNLNEINGISISM
jgi:hypothetical protein